MKYRNSFLKYKLNANADGEGGGGSGAGGDGSQVLENNNQDNVDDFSALWHTDDSDGGEAQAPPQTVQIQQAPANAEDIFNQHVQGLGLDAQTQQFMDAIESREPEQMQKVLLANNKAVYRAAMLDANNMIDKKVATMREEMQQDTTNTITGNSIVAQMETALPFTKNAAYAPIAKAVVSQMLEQPGMTSAKAIENVGKFFTKFAGDVNAGQPRPPGGKPNGGFGNGQYDVDPQASDESEVPDWFEFLGGKPE